MSGEEAAGSAVAPERSADRDPERSADRDPERSADPDVASAAPEAVRASLALALDTDDLVQAVRLARELSPWFGVAKVGLELFSAAGPEVVTRLIDLGFAVFVDLKMFDIPTTVEKAARVVGSLGATYLTLHARDDGPMLRAGADGMRDGAARAGLPRPVPLAVTVLTSDAGAPPHILPRRVALAAETGCGGIVCAAADLPEARQIAPRLVKVVPGIRPSGAPTHDQARAATPRAALDAGADVLVIGRAVTQAEDRAAAAAALVAELV
jgi:orotidine-5'-phosphate decarboxylase